MYSVSDQYRNNKHADNLGATKLMKSGHDVKRGQMRSAGTTGILMMLKILCCFLPFYESSCLYCGVCYFKRHYTTADMGRICRPIYADTAVARIYTATIL